MKNVVITGAYGGMGTATVNLLISQGYRVFALDKKVGDVQENVVPIEVDITNEHSVLGAFNIVKENVDKIDAILHFAGMYMLDSLVEIDDESFKKIFDVNLHGAYLINKVFIPLLKDGSKILITTSELAPLDPLPFTGIYAITKSALDKYAYSLKMELQLLNIQVAVLRAGAVETGMIGASTKALERFCENTKIYTCNAKKFKDIVDRVEARSIKPIKIANKCLKILGKRKLKFGYSINRNPLLRMLNFLPKKTQCKIIKKILKTPKK